MKNIRLYSKQGHKRFLNKKYFWSIT
jgi:hypothetical protein